MPKIFLFSIIFVLFIGPAKAEFTYEDFKKRDAEIYPQEYLDKDISDKIQWLEKILVKTDSPLDRYIFQRNLVNKYYLQNNYEVAIALCRENTPLKKDIYYRLVCISMFRQLANYDDTLVSAFKVAEDAREDNDMTGLAAALTDIGWYQSEAGNVAEALGTYQEILDIVPSSDILMLNDIMSNMATIYIVHGNREYIEKGIELLEAIKNNSANKLKEVLSENERIDFTDYYMLASFNIGIAYTLHLYEYQKALKNFDEVINSKKSDFYLDSLSFSALAASELGEYDLSQKYLSSITEMQQVMGVKEIYLSCYQALAKRHWQPELSLSPCLSLHPNTTLEVTTDVYKRLSKLKGTPEQMEAFRQFYHIYETKIEPELKNRSSKAASNAELKRLKVESALQGEILEKERLLKLATLNEKKANENFFLSVIGLMVLVVSFIFSLLMNKKKLARQFERLSLYDPLTQLGNRRLLEQSIIKELALAERMAATEDNYSLGLFIFDIDHFKSINDTYGHDAGDEVLVEFSQRLLSIKRESDLLIRWGGEEFVLVTRVMKATEMPNIAERIRQVIIDKEFKVQSNTSIKVTCTIGCVKFPFIKKHTDKGTWHDLIAMADLALYWGKENSRNCWVVVNNENIETQEEFKHILTSNINEAITSHKLSINSNSLKT